MVDHDVVRLEIAVDDLLPLGMIEGVAQLGQPRDQLVPPEHAARLLQPKLRQRPPLDVFHEDKGRLLSVLAEVVDLDDIDVDELAVEAHLFPHILHRSRVGPQHGGQQLDGHPLVERGVQGQPHHPHPPPAKRLNHPESSTAQLAAGRELRPRLRTGCMIRWRRWILGIHGASSQPNPPDRGANHRIRPLVRVAIR